MWYSLERFEEQLAVLIGDDESAVTVERVQLPPEARPGDILCICEGAYRLDAAETENRRQRIRRLQEMLRGKRR